MIICGVLNKRIYMDLFAAVSNFPEFFTAFQFLQTVLTTARKGEEVAKQMTGKYFASHLVGEKICSFAKRMSLSDAVFLFIHLSSVLPLNSTLPGCSSLIFYFFFYNFSLLITWLV